MTTAGQTLGGGWVRAALILGIMLSWPVPAQSQRDETGRRTQRTLVYFSGFRGSVMVADNVPAERLLADLLQLELQRLRNFDRRPGAPAPACTPERSSLSAQTARATTTSVTDTPFINIAGVLEGTARVNMTFTVTMCDRGTLTEVKRESRPLDRDAALQDILSTVRAISDAVEATTPRVGVSIVFQSGDSMSARAAGLIEHGIADALLETDDLAPADSASAYILDGVVSMTDRVLKVVVMLRRTGESGVLATIETQAEPESVTAFADALAEQILDRLNQIRFAPPSAEQPSTTDAIESANALLCAGAPDGCVPRPDAALANAQRALTRDSTDARAWVLIGEAEREKKHPTGAIEAFQQANRLIRAEPNRYAEASWAKRVEMGLGRTYASAGNQLAAAEAFGRAARLAPAQADDYYLWARALRSSQRSLEAMEAASEGYKLRADSAGLVEIYFALGGVRVSDVHGKTERLVVACRVAPIVEARCADLLNRWAAPYIEGGTAVDSSAADRSRKARELLSAGAQLANASAESKARTNLYLATLSLGTIEIGTVNGRLRALVRGFDASTADGYLKKAEALPQDQLERGTRDWLQRLRAVYLANTGSFAEAGAAAERGQVAAETRDDAVFLLGQIEIMEALELESQITNLSADSAQKLRNVASRLYEKGASRFRGLLQRGTIGAYPLYRDVSIKLGKRPEVDDQLRNLVRSKSMIAQDLASECVDTFYDFQCAYVLASARLTDNKLQSALDSLEYVEAAVLAEQPVERRWLDQLVSNADPCTKTTAAFFDFWTAIGRTDRERATRSFATWTDASIKQRGYKSASRCWIFGGVRYRLTDRSLPERATLILMVEAMENAEATLPQWPAANRTSTELR